MKRWVDTVIAGILRGGVLLSITIILIGMFITLRQHPRLAEVTRMGAHYPHAVSEVVNGVRAGRGDAIVMMGLLLLIATPVARVAFSIVVFGIERDRLYTAITTLVLLILVVSFVRGVSSS